MQGNATELFDVRVVATQRVKFVMEVVVKCRQLVEADAIAVVREQVAKVETTRTRRASDSKARQLA